MRSIAVRWFVPLLTASLVLGACQAGATPGPNGNPPSGSPPSTSPPTDVPGIAHPTGSADLLLRIESGGGFINPSALFGQLPTLSVFGDGRVVVAGPQIEVFPPPALPNFVSYRISEEGVQKLLENAQAVGLLGPDAHYDSIGIADAPTTTFTVVAGGQRHTISAYALSEGGPNDTQLTPEVRRARAALFAFEQRASDLRAWLGSAIVEPESPYRFEALRIFATPAQPDAQGGVAPGFADWPLATPVAAFGAPLANVPETRCGVISDGDLDTLRPALDKANQATFWRSGGATFQLTLRPLLPDESGCPSLP